MVRSPENVLHVVPFIPPTIALFNFQVKTMNGSIACPFPGLNAVTKELFLCLKFLATLLSIGFIFVIHRALSKCFYLENPSSALYLAAALEILLLGYETLADTKLSSCTVFLLGRIGACLYMGTFSVGSGGSGGNIYSLPS